MIHGGKEVPFPYPLRPIPPPPHSALWHVLRHYVFTEIPSYSRTRDLAFCIYTYHSPSPSSPLPFHPPPPPLPIPLHSCRSLSTTAPPPPPVTLSLEVYPAVPRWSREFPIVCLPPPPLLYPYSCEPFSTLLILRNHQQPVVPSVT